LNIYWTSLIIIASAALIYSLNRKPEQNILPSQKNIQSLQSEQQSSQIEIQTEIQTEQTELQTDITEFHQGIKPSAVETIKSETASKPTEVNIQIPEKKLIQTSPPDKVVIQEVNKIVKKAHPKPEVKSVAITPIFDSAAEKPTGEKEVIPQSSTENLVKALFIPSATKGCQPCQLNFTNLSENAVEYYWDFGDGGTSDKAQPEYIFDEAGSYIVSLTVTGENDMISRYSTSINVSSPPVANFKPDYQGNPAEGVYFYNYSRGASEYLWDFGDGTTSTDKEPMHSYTQEGSYDISLMAISSDGCIDSLILKDAFAESGVSISFPTAFSPNPDGPIGGYYEAGERNTNVFHPYTEDIPMEYNLKIFNRRAVLLFESNDIRIGWDGYYRQELQPQGVYIYKLRGRFSNGKTFVKTGDVTLIWKRRY
jgi:PKD repeat protein